MNDSQRATDLARVGFIGLGNIGAPMAKRLVDWPGGLWVFDVVAAATDPFAEAGATVAAGIDEVATSCDVISVMVRDDAQVRDVVGEIARHAPAGTVVAIHSTIAPGTASALAAAHENTGIEIVDAPVSGGAIGAATGELAAMVGGADECGGTLSGGVRTLGEPGRPPRPARRRHERQAGKEPVALREFHRGRRSVPHRRSRRRRPGTAGRGRAPLGPGDRGSGGDHAS